jgi:hypothetical protein
MLVGDGDGLSGWRCGVCEHVVSVENDITLSYDTTTRSNTFVIMLKTKISMIITQSIYISHVSNGQNKTKKESRTQQIK